MEEWDDAASSRHLKVQSIARLIPGYSYSTESHAHRTDEMFCSLLVENLRECKREVFNILDTAFGLHREAMTRDIEKLRDEMDVFSDEVKVRAFRWDRQKSEKWLSKLIDYDYRILTGLGNITSNVRVLRKEFLELWQDTAKLRSFDSHVVRLQHDFAELIAMFKERDAVCNISDATLEDTFERMRSKIRKGFGP